LGKGLTTPIIPIAGAVPSFWDNPFHFGAIYFITIFLIQSTFRSFEFFLEPFPKPCIIKPYYDHHHHKYYPGAKVIHGYTSFREIKHGKQE
jgi:hypothetical protein